MIIEKRKEYIDNQYDLFFYEYVRLNPPPETDTASKRRSLLIMLVASIIVSAHHSIPFFIGDNVPNDLVGQAITIIISISVVAMVEIGLVKLGEFLIEYLSDDLVGIMRPALLLVSLILLIFVAVPVNVIEQLSTRDIFVNENINTAVTILVGVTAPLMALNTGVIFASLELNVTKETQQWQRQFNQQWRTFKKKNDINITVSKPTDEPTDNPLRLSMSMSNQTDNRQSGSGFNRASSATDNAVEWLKANPDKVGLPLRELAELIPNAGKDSIGKARKIIQSEAQA